MEKILRVNFPLSFKTVYLGKMNLVFTHFGDKYMFRVMLVASKKAITKEMADDRGA